MALEPKEYRITQKVESYEEYFVIAHNEEQALRLFHLGEYDRMIAQVEAAAEQRGAVQHLREVASELNMRHVTEDLSDEALELGVRFVNLIQDRADQMEAE